VEPKKSPKADLENKRNLFFQIGLVIALAITLFAFEWATKVKQIESLGIVSSQEVEDEFIPITRQEEVKPPPPPPVATVEILNIVDDNVEIEDELEIQDSEADNETEIDATPIIQSAKEEEEEAQVFFIVEEMPEFPGGELALRKYISLSIRYPKIAQDNSIQGKVYVNFVVNGDGSVSDAKVARSVDPSLDKEALRVVNNLPKWKPGKQRGKPARVLYTVPINFVLN